MADQLVFEIGTPDRNYQDLAIPGRWEDYAPRFGEGVVFTVGQDQADQSWPYIHPGPDNFWGGFQRHPFLIRFHLDDQPTGFFALRLHLIAGHWQDPPILQVSINNSARQLQVPIGPDDGPLRQADQGEPFCLPVVFAAPLLKKGENEIALTSITGSWFIYDAVQLQALAEQPRITGLSIRNTPAFVHHEAGPRPLVKVVFEGAPLFKGGTLEICRQDQVLESLPIPASDAGMKEIEVALPVQETDRVSPFTLRLETRGQVVSRDCESPILRRWQVYLLHHTHLDIGYTHTQEEVKIRQIGFLDDALGFAEETRDFPREARFKWLPEGLWPVEAYLEQASEEEKQAFIQAVKADSISLDALFGNALTSLACEEELIALTACAQRLKDRYGLKIDSAMITDVPGLTWGLVPALCQAGVKTLSVGPNRNHRIGYTLSQYGDRPFYWTSPSGKDRLLCWTAGEGYSWFHAGLNFTLDYEALTSKRTPRRIFDYLERLEKDDYPYRMLQIRYNIGSDNGPPDPTLAGFVKDWNDKYYSPQLIIATTSEMGRAFEAEYAEKIPVLQGDLTPYWEDGAASTARDTALARTARERLIQAAALFTLLDPDRFPAEAFYRAWREVLLYNEHTWGAWNSISEPDAEFVVTQAAWKSARAKNADEQSRSLMVRALEGVTDDTTEESPWVTVFNTNSQTRTDWVCLPPELSRAGDRVIDFNGWTSASQRLASGELAFKVYAMPPLSARSFLIAAGEGAQSRAGSARVNGCTLQTNSLCLEIDPESGAIASLRLEGIEEDLVDTRRHSGLNDYIYVEGRDAHDQRRIQGPVTITPLDTGPMVASLKIESTAPGCKRLVRVVRVVHGLNRVEVIDTLDREKVRTPEGLHLAFPLNVPDGVIRIDMPFAVVRPEADQLRGANKDFFPVQRWVDCSNEKFGVTLATPDAPILEVGAITMDTKARGGRWSKKVQPGTTLYSYVMNNYWETNYAADQEGETTFRYWLEPHVGPYDAARAHAFGLAASRPLIVARVQDAKSLPESLVRVVPAGVLITSIQPSADGAAFMVRLFNGSNESVAAELHWREQAISEMRLSSPREEKGAVLKGSLEMAAMEVVTLRCERPVKEPIKQ